MINKAHQSGLSNERAVVANVPKRIISFDFRMLDILNDNLITEFYIIIISTLVFIVLTSVWLFYLLNTDLFLKFGLR